MSFLKNLKGVVSLEDALSAIKKAVTRTRPIPGPGIAIQDTPQGQMIRLKVQTGGGSSTSGAPPSSCTDRARIKDYTVGTGVYTVDIYGNGYSSDPTELGTMATPTVITFTPLGVGEKCIVMKDEVETLGDDES